MASLSAFNTVLLRQKWHAAFTHLEAKAAGLSSAFKAGFDPNQPRAPAGNPNGGRWVGGDGSRERIRRKPASRKPTQQPPKSPVKPAQKPKLKIPVPRTPIRDTSPLEPPPKIPRRRPATKQEINAIAKSTAKWIAKAAGTRLLGLAGLVIEAIEAVDWIDDQIPLIQSYFDDPKSLVELRRAVSKPKKGYGIHHIVEKTPAALDGFPRSMIDAPENLVRIPTIKHCEITGWYLTKNKDFGGLSPREYLRRKDWEERLNIGRDALVDHGVLKP